VAHATKETDPYDDDTDFTVLLGKCASPFAAGFLPPLCGVPGRFTHFPGDVLYTFALPWMAYELPTLLSFWGHSLRPRSFLCYFLARLPGCMWIA
jgi:hypothetical protein